MVPLHNGALGLLAGYIIFLLLMLFIPLCPALFAYWSTPHCRCSAPLSSLISDQFSSDQQYDPDFIPRLTQSLVHLFFLTHVPHAYSAVTFALFDGQCAMTLVIPFKQKKHLPQFQGTNAACLMKFGLASVVPFHLVLIP
jgi:hypothetical protein